MNAQRYTADELLAILSARQLKDGQVVFAGVGIPLLAATLAQRLRCPGLTILFEGGVIGAFIEPGKLPPSTNDQRCTMRANMVLGSADVLLLLQRGYVDVGFMGGAQIDQYGNLNSSFIGDPAHPKTRLPGTGGGNDISSLTDMIVAMKHEKRRFVENVDFVTSPGFLRGGDSRAESGLPTGGMFRVVTDLAVFGFDDDDRRMKVARAQSRRHARSRCRTTPASSWCSTTIWRSPSRRPTRAGDAARARSRAAFHRLKRSHSEDKPLKTALSRHVWHRRAQLHRLSGNAGRQGRWSSTACGWRSSASTRSGCGITSCSASSRISRSSIR